MLISSEMAALLYHVFIVLHMLALESPLADQMPDQLAVWLRVPGGRLSEGACGLAASVVD